METETKLLPCPFCGSTSATVRSSSPLEMRIVVCHNCHSAANFEWWRERFPVVIPNQARSKELSNRISQYLQVGGFFNPEHMEHNKVRDLLIDCRAHIDSL